MGGKGGASGSGGGAAAAAPSAPAPRGLGPPQREAFERARGLYTGAAPPASSLVHRLRWVTPQGSGARPTKAAEPPDT